MKRRVDKIINYDGRDDLAAMRWLPLVAARAVRPERVASEIDLKFRSADKVGLPVGDKAAWDALCDEVKDSPFHDGFVQLGNHEKTGMASDELTLACIDVILSRGDRSIIEALVLRILRDPTVANQVVKLYSARKPSAVADPEFTAGTAYEAAHWLARLSKEFPL